jgi:hypothetical protein
MFSIVVAPPSETGRMWSYWRSKLDWHSTATRDLTGALAQGPRPEGGEMCRTPLAALDFAWECGIWFG